MSEDQSSKVVEKALQPIITRMMQHSFGDRNHYAAAQRIAKELPGAAIEALREAGYVVMPASAERFPVNVSIGDGRPFEKRYRVEARLRDGLAIFAEKDVPEQYRNHGRPFGEHFAQLLAGAIAELLVRRHLAEPIAAALAAADPQLFKEAKRA